MTSAYLYGPVRIVRNPQVPRTREWEVWEGDRLLVSKPTLGGARDWVLLRSCPTFVPGDGKTAYADVCANCGGHREAHTGGEWT